MQQFLVDIALPVPLDRTFTYLVPPEFQPFARTGSRALVPFGKKKLSGVIVGLPPTTTVKGLKPLLDLLDAEPTFSEEMLNLTRWMSEYYFAPWGEVLKAATPQGLTIESTQQVRLMVDDVRPLLEDTKPAAPKQHAALLALQASKELTVLQLQKKVRARSIHALLHQMEEKGWISLEETTKAKAKPKIEKFVTATESGRDAAAEPNKPAEKRNVRLTANQSKLLVEVTKAEEPLPIQLVLKRLGIPLSTMKSLEKKGLVIFTKREVIRKSEYEPVGPAPQFELNAHQRRALTHIAPEPTRHSSCTA